MTKPNEYDPKKLKTLLVKSFNREYFFSQEVAQAFGVSLYAVQRARKNHKLGHKLPTGRRGTFVYRLEDIEALCSILQGCPGNYKKGKH